MSGAIEERASFEEIRYANCWEDAELLLQGFEVLRGQRFVSICSAGDNTLALLLLDPSEVVAADLSTAQLACLDLRMAAIRLLERPELLAFLGITAPLRDRTDVYARLRLELPIASRSFWDAHLDAVKMGIVHAGKFERYFAAFRRWILPLVQSMDNRQRLVAFTDAAAQKQFYASEWNNWRWRLLFRLFFSRAVMGRSGRDPEFFRYVEGSVADRILARTERALADIPGAENPWLQFIVAGNFTAALPPYLQEDRLPLVKDRLDRIRRVLGPVHTALHDAAPRVTGWNLSDIFEYMDAPLAGDVLDALLRSSASESRLAYWNMLAPRDAALMRPDRLHSCADEAARLFRTDRAFFYSAYHLDEVCA